MARYFANPKPYSKTLNRKFLKYILYIACAMLGMALAFWVSQTKDIFAALLGYGFLALFLYTVDYVYKQIAKNDRGEDAEYEIKNILERLSNDYIIFHNVPIKQNLDIDLVLVGPIGVYAIEVKSYRKFRLYGNGKDFINETLAEALGLKKYLEDLGINIFVNSVLVFSRAFVKYQDPQKGVHIMNKKFLIPLLERGRPVNFDRTRTEEAIKKLYLS